MEELEHLPGDPLDGLGVLPVEVAARAVQHHVTLVHVMAAADGEAAAGLIGGGGGAVLGRGGWGWQGEVVDVLGVPEI